MHRHSRSNNLQSAFSQHRYNLVMGNGFSRGQSSTMCTLVLMCSCVFHMCALSTHQSDSFNQISKVQNLKRDTVAVQACNCCSKLIRRLGLHSAGSTGNSWGFGNVAFILQLRSSFVLFNIINKSQGMELKRTHLSSW